MNKILNYEMLYYWYLILNTDIKLNRYIKKKFSEKVVFET